MKLLESAKAYTNKQFIKKSQEKHQLNGEPLYDYSKTEYISSNQPVIIICKTCGSEFSQRASHHLNGSGCKKCANEKMRTFRTSNTSEFIEKAKNIHGERYNYKDVVYVTNLKKVKILCNKCDTEFLQTPQSHLNGNGCPICARTDHSKKMLKTNDMFISNAKNLHKNHKNEPLYDYSKTDYKGANLPIIIICKKCKKEFIQRASHHLNGSGCINCTKSRSEKYIESVLLINNIQYVSQKRFDDCKNTITLPFDFYLPKYNICIEFDGTHHYEVKKSHGGFDRLVKQKENDKIKTKYCQNKGIKLFRIKYSEVLKESVQDILDYIKNQTKNEI